MTDLYPQFSDAYSDDDPKSPGYVDRLLDRADEVRDR